MRLGISGQALSKVNTLQEILTILNRFDVENIELWGDNVPFISGKDGYDDGYIDKDAQLVAKMAEKHGVHIGCVTFGGAFDETLFKVDPSVYSDQLVETVRFAKKVGAEVVNHYCFHISMDEHVDIERIKRYMSPAIEEAERLCIPLALENEAHDSTASPEQMKFILESIGSRYFGTNFDATNYYHAGCEGFPFGYDLLKDYIKYVHIKNGCIYKEETHSGLDGKGTPMSGLLDGKTIFYPTLGEGAVNIAGLLARLERDGYNGLVTLEPHVSPSSVEAYYEKEIAFLRKEFPK